ncbi:MAG: hypothetical protein JWM35_2052, partial [Verrucomicrobia bacterium]|nr:hypothetical protein [Verrucomicrobiota bacterium]
VYFSKEDFPAALEWFDRAIAVEPNSETAHRYRADALMRLKRIDEAGNGYVNAFVAAPFAPVPTEALNSWVKKRNLTLHRTNSSFIAGRIRIVNGAPNIVIDGNQINAPSMAYLLGRTAYLTKHKISAAHYQNSLAEEAAGIRSAVQTMTEVSGRTRTDQKLEPFAKEMDAITRLDRDGLLEAFILLDRPTTSIMDSYPGYRESHRDELVRYIRKVWLRL